MDISFPYGEASICLDLPDRNLIRLIEANEVKGQNEEELIENALNNPINSLPLEDFNGDSIIVVDDKTRPLPSKRLLPPILKRLKGDVTIMFATGSHTPMSKPEAEKFIGSEILKNYKWESHSQEAEFIEFGTSTYGTPLFFNAAYADAEVKISVGDVEYHYFAGYGGGRKSILPGVASQCTIQANHKRMFHEKSKFGVLNNNPVHDDMVDGVNKVGLDFCFNIVMNSCHEIVGAYAGNHIDVLKRGASLVDQMYGIPIDEKADAAIIAADGFPHDINLYQAMKAIQTVIHSIKKNGTLILIAECRDGHGSTKFYDEMERYDDSISIKKDLLSHFIMGKHKVYYMLAAAEHAKIFTVTSMDESLSSHFGMEKIKEDMILDVIYERHGQDARILASPHASTTLVNLNC